MTTAIRPADAREMIALARASLDTAYASFHRGEIDLDTLIEAQDQIHVEIATIRARTA